MWKNRTAVDPTLFELAQLEGFGEFEQVLTWSETQCWNLNVKLVCFEYGVCVYVCVCSCWNVWCGCIETYACGVRAVCVRVVCTCELSTQCSGVAMQGDRVLALCDNTY